MGASDEAPGDTVGTPTLLSPPPVNWRFGGGYLKNCIEITMMNDGIYDYTPLETTELCDQCRALAFAITELTHPIARDILLWVLVERIEMLSLRLESEDHLLTEI